MTPSAPPRTFQTLRNQFKAERAKRKAMHPLQRVIYDTPRAIMIVFPRKLKEFWYDLEERWAQILYGHSDLDWYSYYSRNSKRAVKLLSLLQSKGHSFRCMKVNQAHDCWEDDICAARWNKAIEDMIFYHKVLAGMYKEFRIPQYPFEEDDEELTEVWEVCETLNEITDPERITQFVRGKYFYFQYYESLWD